MKIFIFSFLFLTGVAKVGFTQTDFAPIGAEWYYSPWCLNVQYDCDYYTLKVLHDTIVAGKNARFVQYYHAGIPIDEASLIVYSDSGKVFYYLDTSFYLLYDFNLSAGDTMISAVDSRANYYSTYGEPNSIVYFKSLVDSIGLITIDGVNLKIQFFDLISPLNDIGFYQWRHYGPVIEKIGDINFSFLGHSESFIMTGFEGHIRCYSDSQINYQPYSHACDFVLEALDIKNKSNELIIYPNPVSDLLSFNIYSNEKYFNISIYNSQCRLIRNQFSSKMEIDVSDLSPGLYLLRINENFTKTFIKT